MMRVAYVCADPGVPVFGSKGCSLHVQEVLRTFCERGDTVELFTVRAGVIPAADLELVKVHEIGIRKTSTDADREIALYDTNETLRELLHAEGPFDLIYERHALWSYAAMEFAQEQGIASALEVNAPLIDEQAKYRRLLNRELAEACATRSVRVAKLVAPVSSQLNHYLQYLEVDSAKVEVLPNGVRHERFKLPEYRAHIAEPFRVGFVGSLRPWHAVQDLIQAYAKLHSPTRLEACELSIVGDGPLRESLAELVTMLPESIRSQIRLAGAVSSAEVPKKLHAMDVAVAPYSGGDDCYFSPLKLFEYMAAGLPIIAARTGQMVDILNDGVTGVLYTPGNSGELAEKIDWVRSNPHLAERIGRRARETAISQHSWRSRVQTVLSKLGLDQPATVAS